MSERERQLDRTTDTDEFELEFETDNDADLESEPANAGLRGWLSSLVSTRELVAAFVTTVIGLVVLGGLVPLGLLGGLVGVFVGGFVYGLGASSRPYLPLAIAGGLVTAVWQVLTNVTLTIVGPGVSLALVALVGGLLAAVGGGYFGQDLRRGLTRDLTGDGPPR